MSDKNTLGLSRRRLLGGLGAIGVASAGAGLGTSAYFSDVESFDGNSMTAGALDLKVGWEEHYSNWSDDEGNGINGTVEMEQGANFTAGSTVGSPRVGLPANAAAMLSFNNSTDAQQFLDNTQEDVYPDGPNGYDSSDFMTGTSIDCTADNPGLADDDAAPPVIELDDVKPGDFGEVTFSFAICDNPGYVWAQAFLEDASENGLNEPEMADEDEDQTINSTGDVDPADGDVELLDEIMVAIWLDDGSNSQNCGEQPLTVGSLRDTINNIPNPGQRLDGRNVPEGSTAAGNNKQLTATGVNRFDVNQDGSWDVDFELADDPAGNNRKVAKATSGGQQTEDYASSVVSVCETIGDIDSLTYQYYEGDENTNANPDEVVLLIQEADGTQHVVFRTAGSANNSNPTEDTWQTRDVGAELSGGVSGWHEIEDGGGYSGISDPETEYGSDATVLSMGAGVGNTNGGSGSVSEIYVANPQVDTGDGAVSLGNFPTACFRGGGSVYNGVFAWWLPVDHGNEIQSDSATFTLGLYTEQCRHNDGSGQPPETQPN
ncbi:SipW-dependent-type signal peptide-containing protein [Haloarchaeobius sp. FL176]|uniref:SipW-dependent-type signal peptide-containing protein n=1 Tax=Haloarchaeobius sp. FL176 TaxID=2967129 RepID=UPI0021497F55|nr:SipW-dependent-type signal peptide-containing protein [Haloarchaeobius sp. FL176]